jgi:hypothetical protein
VLSGSFVVFIARVGNTNKLEYKRYNHTTSVIVDAAGQPINAGPVNAVHAAADVSGSVWGAYANQAGISVFRLNPGTQLIDATASFAAPGPSQYTRPFVTIVGTETWVFWTSNEGLRLARYTGSWTTLGLVPHTIADDDYVSCVVMADGRVLVTYRHNIDPGQLAVGVYASIVTPSTLEWSPPQAISTSLLGAATFTGVLAPNRTVLGIWTRSVDPGGVGVYHNYYKWIAAPL